MADLSGMRREAFGRAQRAQHFAANYAGMNPAERHKKFVNDYLTYYGRGDAAAQQQPVTVTKTDLDALKEEHRFIRTADDDADERWEARLAKKVTLNETTTQINATVLSHGSWCLLSTPRPLPDQQPLGSLLTMHRCQAFTRTVTLSGVLLHFLIRLDLVSALRHGTPSPSLEPAV